MTKEEAVNYIKASGREAVLENGVVVVITPKPNTKIIKEFEKLIRELRKAGYMASIGIRGKKVEENV
ncbi:MAG: hypothetical protein Q4B26_14120 [Eubacteriales bacterium]|nr:hypothetical protein [Eubacteriales bacterium]